MKYACEFYKTALFLHKFNVLSFLVLVIIHMLYLYGLFSIISSVSQQFYSAQIIFKCTCMIGPNVIQLSTTATSCTQ